MLDNNTARANGATFISQSDRMGTDGELPPFADDVCV